jgi:hypothetical protein
MLRERHSISPVEAVLPRSAGFPDVVSAWPQSPSTVVETPQPPQTPPGSQIAAESAYWRFGVNFDIRKSMSSPTP